ncbi:hypothetical protein PLESTB_000522100 [Pleodorina starrii]|uniref:Transmembrane protein 186 n=1 Tax=Pleodorina starrii TaxID=330485 RepID=A0A9W6BHI9_9CHLO|nr:hypothetical protein PLESTM_000385600 [Pleodorina starrii]GLC51621.1 hypothetical protein PLESTB_000522100 [Pleodorina starrii]GLC72390.1 hypothetical protein PLESTF_001242400 [Pleodorina starrii]
MSRIQGALGFLLPSRCCFGYATAASHTLQTQLCNYEHNTSDGDASERQSSWRGLIPEHAGCRSPGPFLLFASDAATAVGTSSLLTSRFLSSSSKASLFDGLKLQAPSNPFAPRKPRPSVQKLVLYRGRGMLLFRFIVRAKVFQLMGFLACTVFASVVLTTSNPNPMDLAAVGALAVGCVITSYCIWYYSGRYVGEMSLLLPERRLVRFSVLDFWGNREDNDVPLEQLVAPWRNRSVAEVRSQARQALMPLEVAGDRQYYISVPHGHVLQKEVLQKILYGAPLEEATDAAAVGAAAGGDMQAPATGPSEGSSSEQPGAQPTHSCGSSTAGGQEAEETDGRTGEDGERRDGGAAAQGARGK